MRQYHFHLKNAGFENSYFHVGSDRKTALDSCMEEFKKDNKEIIDYSKGEKVNV